MYRATAYGIWSLLVPAGYNRDPTAHFGYKKVAMIYTILCISRQNMVNMECVELNTLPFSWEEKS